MSASRPLERAAAILLMGSVGAVFVKLSVAQSLFGIAAILWLVVVRRDRTPHPLPAFAMGLCVYAALTIVSALMSADRATSILDLRQLVLFLMVPLVVRLWRGHRAMQALDVVIAVGSAAALLGVVQYAMFGFDNLAKRPLGFLTHWMTYSGVIMLVLAAAVARLLYFPRQIIWPAVAIPALTVALAVTNTRGAWLGAAAAVIALVVIRRPKWLLLAPVVALVAVLVTPAPIRTRALSITDPNDPSNRDRIQMLQMGVDIVRDHPWFGVGPDMVGRVYGRYLRPNPVHTYNPHLHNVPMQIAAERGLPALAAWLLFVALAGWSLLRLLRVPDVAPLAAVALASLLALLVAGLFEYNFGDSEVLMLFLALLSLPFAARAGDRVPAAASPRAASHD